MPIFPSSATAFPASRQLVCITCALVLLSTAWGVEQLPGGADWTNLARRARSHRDVARRQAERISGASFVV